MSELRLSKHTLASTVWPERTIGAHRSQWLGKTALGAIDGGLSDQERAKPKTVSDEVGHGRPRLRIGPVSDRGLAGPDFRPASVRSTPYLAASIGDFLENKDS